MTRCGPLALLLASVLFACATPRAEPRRSPSAHTATIASVPAAESSSRPPTPRELATIEGLMHETERIRGLSFKRPVEVRIQDQRAMRAYVSAALKQDELDRTRQRYVALGLLAPEVDVRTLIESLMEEELVGYYDPREQRLAIRDDVARAFAAGTSEDTDLEWRATVVHELVHALQDQHLGLGAALDAERTTDADNAFGALVEGDATLAMLAYAADQSGISLESLVSDRQELASMLQGAPESLTGRMRAAPAIVRDPLLFRYREGALFAAKLTSHGGFRAVDAAHRTPPSSTREIIEPLHFLRHEKTVSIALPGLRALAGGDHTILDEDTLGRLELGIYLGTQGQQLAADWVADRYVVFRHGARLGVFWLIQFGHTKAARRVETAIQGAHAPVGVSVQRRGPYLLVMRGIAPELGPQLVTEFNAWTATH